jgi:hypothetical protein
VTVGHAPSLVILAISCHFLSFVLPSLVVLFFFVFFLMPSAGMFLCPFFGFF